MPDNTAPTLELMQPERPPRPKQAPEARGSWTGQLSRMRKDFFAYLQDSAKEGGDVVCLRPTPISSMYLLSHPEDVRRVLVTDAEHYEKSSQTRKMVGKFLGKGLVLSEGEEHRHDRQLVQAAFQAERIASYAPAMVARTERLLSNWKSGQNIDVEQSMKGLTLEIVADALFGTELVGTGHEIRDAMAVFADSISSRFRSIPWPEWMPTKANRDAKAAIRTMHSVVDNLIAVKQRDIAAGKGGSDLLTQLLASGNTERVRDHVITLFFAGHETIAGLTSWAIHAIATNPGVEARLKAELKEVLGDRAPTAADLPKLKFLENVIKETMRMYPPAWVFDRQPKEDVVIRGCKIPKGSTVYLSPYVLHRDPRWFPEPEKFRPQRFEQERSIPKGAYIPFGSGPRYCIGHAFAMQEAKLILATIFSRAHLTPDPTCRVVPAPSATLGFKNGLRMGVELSS